MQANKVQIGLVGALMLLGTGCPESFGVDVAVRWSVWADNPALSDEALIPFGPTKRAASGFRTSTR